MARVGRLLQADVLRLVAQWDAIETRAKQANGPTLLHREPGIAVRVIREEFNADYRGVYIDDPGLYAEVREYVDSFNPELSDRIELFDPSTEGLPLFERFHAYQLEKVAHRHAAAGTFAGHEVYTGNLSLPRALFLRAGGFDPAFFIEDVELGVRLERCGATFVFSREAAAVHASDHTSLEGWLDRCHREGRDWVRLARKHPWAHDASPWSFMSKANPHRDSGRRKRRLYAGSSSFTRCASRSSAPSSPIVRSQSIRRISRTQGVWTEKCCSTRERWAS